ncbi:MAG: lasso peptide biosynthesis B2 protein [Sulfurovaceae bacterium]
MRKVLWNFLYRPIGEKLLALEAACYLAVIKILLRSTSFNAIAKRYGMQMTQAERCRQYNDIKALKTIGWAIERMSLAVPWNSVCLDKALAAQRMLARRKIDGILYLGVAKKDDQSSEIKAHAWVCCGEHFITGRTEHEEFTVVSRFEW